MTLGTGFAGGGGENDDGDYGDGDGRKMDVHDSVNSKERRSASVWI